MIHNKNERLLRHQNHVYTKNVPFGILKTLFISPRAVLYNTKSLHCIEFLILVIQNVYTCTIALPRPYGLTYPPIYSTGV